MTNAKVAIELYVDDKGTLRIKQFATDSEQSFKKVEQAGTGAAARIRQSWDALKGAWVSVLAGIMAVREGWDMMNASAKAQQEKNSFAALAASYGANSKKIIASLQEVSAGTVDTMTLIRNAGTAMMMGINPEDTIGLMEIAYATAKQTGQTTVKAFEDITLAVGRQSKMILDNLGIIVDVEKANETYAKSINKTAAQLTDAEKKQAFMTATMAAGKDLMAKMGNQSDTTADKFQRFTATMSNIKVAIGDLLIRGFYLLEGAFNGAAAGTLYFTADIFGMIGAMAMLSDFLHLTSGAADEWNLKSKAATSAADDLVKKTRQSFKDMMSSNDAIIKGQSNYTGKIKETIQAIEEQEKAEKKIFALHKKEADDKEKVQEEMYKELGVGADAYFSAEASELVKKAAKWKAAGADTLAVEEWLYDQLGTLSAQAWEKQESAAGLAMDNLQAQAGTLVDEVTNVTAAGIERLQAMGIEIEGLDGSAFTVYASLDGSGVESTVDSLIAKFQALRAAAVIPIAPAGGNSSPAVAATSPQTTEQWADSIENTPSNYNATTININQQLSRSDVNAIITEQSRQEARS